MAITSQSLTLLLFCSFLLLTAPCRKAAADDVDDLLLQLNKPYVKSINSPDGDIIDCVDIYSQPGFDDPAMKNRTIEFIPGDYPKDLLPENEVESEGILPQIWQQAGSCPEGTIPMRRTTREDVIRARTTAEGGYFARKRPNSWQRPDAYSVQVDPPNYNEKAIGTKTDGKFFGARGWFGVWKPRVQGNEFSSSQLWVVSDEELDGPEINIVEAGWQVYPAMYGDDRPRFFNYFTRDNSVSTGCYNLQCSGFIQTSSRFALGAALEFSEINGVQHALAIYIFKSSLTNNWLLHVGSEQIGYWPEHLFTGLSESAYTLQWGGEVINTRPGGQHTTTQMGSGQFPNSGFKISAAIDNVRVVDSTYALAPAYGLSIYSSNWNCYGISLTHGTPQYGLILYYGGPGRNPNCR